MSWLNYLDSSYFFLLLSLSSFLGSDCRDLNLGYVRPCITWQADSSCLLVSWYRHCTWAGVASSSCFQFPPDTSDHLEADSTP